MPPSNYRQIAAAQAAAPDRPSLGGAWAVGSVLQAVNIPGAPWLAIRRTRSAGIGQVRPKHAWREPASNRTFY